MERYFREDRSFVSKPNITKALLVGIEKYEAGEDWNLNGPAHDVMRMAQWLDAQGVPTENLTLFLSPLDDNLAIVEKVQKLTGRKPANAIKSEIQDELRRIRQESASLFFFYWGGHGWVTQEGERRLFYADSISRDERNLDFNDLLVTMRSDFYKKMPKQLFIVDACANYVRNVKNQPPSDKLAKGQPIPSQEQFALFAAKFGDTAKNLNSEQTGLYTKELLAEFESLSPNEIWSPDMEKISARLQRRFIDLRTKGLAEQTPTFLWNRDWIGNERQFSEMPVGPAVKIPLPIIIPKLPRRLNIMELTQIRNHLVACDSLRDFQKRDKIVNMLSPECSRIINRANDINTDVINIFQTVRNYSGELKVFLYAINFFESNSIQFQALSQVLIQIIPEEMN